MLEHGAQCCHALLLLLLVSGSWVSAQMEKGSSSSSGGGRSTSTSISRSSSSSSSTRSTSGSTSGWYVASSGTSSYNTVMYYGRCYGATSTTIRLAGVTILASYAYFNGFSYPSMRFYYADGQYLDDCALRNATAAQQGLSDASIDLATVNALPQLIPDAATGPDLLTFNQTLYNTTNGLIVDPAYCNYTVAGTAGQGLRWSAGWALALAAAAALFLGGSSAQTTWL